MATGDYWRLGKRAELLLERFRWKLTGFRFEGRDGKKKSRRNYFLGGEFVCFVPVQGQKWFGSGFVYKVTGPGCKQILSFNHHKKSNPEGGGVYLGKQKQPWSISSVLVGLFVCLFSSELCQPFVTIRIDLWGQTLAAPNEPGRSEYALIVGTPSMAGWVIERLKSFHRKKTVDMSRDPPPALPVKAVSPSFNKSLDNCRLFYYILGWCKFKGTKLRPLIFFLLPQLTSSRLWCRARLTPLSSNEALCSWFCSGRVALLSSWLLSCLSRWRLQASGPTLLSHSQGWWCRNQTWGPIHVIAQMNVQPRRVINSSSR